MAKEGKTTAEAKLGTSQFINSQIETGTYIGLGAALHANEDRFADGHEFQELDGHITMEHVIDDWFPNISDVIDAFMTD